METILRFMKQPSTQRSLLAVVGLIGWQLSPENLEAIISGVVAVFAVIEGFRDEDKLPAQRGTTVPGPKDPGP